MGQSRHLFLHDLTVNMFIMKFCWWLDMNARPWIDRSANWATTAALSQPLWIVWTRKLKMLHLRSILRRDLNAQPLHRMASLITTSLGVSASNSYYALGRIKMNSVLSKWQREIKCSNRLVPIVFSLSLSLSLSLSPSIHIVFQNFLFFYSFVCFTLSSLL